MGLRLSDETEAWLRAGAEATVNDGDNQAARRFQAGLELAYLVASADGLAEAERSVLATALSEATGTVIDREAFARHFRDLDDAVAALGRRERLNAAAASFDHPIEREEALRFAAVVAMADLHLDPKELAVLEELGGLFAWPRERVHTFVEGLR